jgi:glycerate kinase
MVASGQPVRIVVAMDSFKGSLPATEACEAVRRGVLQELPEAQLTLRPMADGGEGTARTIMDARGGQWIPARVTGPLPQMAVDAGYAWLADAGPGAVVEMATASGLALLDTTQRDPMSTTTLGTGELMGAALARGAQRLWLAIGGSATVDGGVGAATALGWRFLDRKGTPVNPGGGQLERIATIERPVDDTCRVPIQVLCDVDNPLVGPRGAARIFGPQKGATDAGVERLECGLMHLADLIDAQLGIDVRDLQGGGASGGLGAGLVAFADAHLVSGVDEVMEVIGIQQALKGADWVITGEGRFDQQSLHGKVVSGIARTAAAAGARVAVIAGQVDLAGETASGIDVALASCPPHMPLAEAMSEAGVLLQEAARRLTRQHLVS